MLMLLLAGLCLSAVLPSQHRATVSASHRASRVAAASMAVRPPEPTIEVSVRRTPEGGLGIQVDETNTVASCPGQPDLAIGDRIVAINGEQLGRRYLAEVLPPPAEFASIYLFTIERGSADAMDSMERRLERLTEMASADTLAELAKDEVLTSKIVLLAEALEAAAEPQPEAAVAEALRGFWRLAFTNGTMAEGLTGYGTLPMCYVSGLFSAFTETKPDKPDVPTAQLVEVVADRNMGSSNVAALKGDWEVLPPATLEGRGLFDIAATYSRLEYAGSPTRADVTRVTETCVFLGESLRVGWCNGAVMVYQRSDPATAQREIARLIDLRVQRDGQKATRDDIPRWEQADLMRKGDPGREVDAGAAM